MAITIVCGLAFIGALVCLFISRKYEKNPGKSYIDYRKVLGWTGVVVALLAAFGWVLGGINPVPVKNVGVEVTFGHVSSQTLRPGFHWLFPWVGVSNLSEAVQTNEFVCGTPTYLKIRIGGQQTACLNLTIQWQVKDSAAGELFNLYDTTGNVQGQITDAVVTQHLRSVVNQVMGDYNPIQDVSVSGVAGNSQFSTFAPKILAQMRRDIGSQIVVRAVILSTAEYDTSTQDRLNAIQQQYADTAVAQQQVKTNEAQAAANNAVSKSVSSNPGVLTQECLSITQLAIKSSYALPAGWNCVGSSTSSSIALNK